MSRSVFALVLLVLLAPALGCSGEDAGRACATADQCPARARCLDRLCVSDTPPVAAIQGLDAFAERSLATFDGSDSHDADPDDAVVTWRWAIRATEATCPAPPAPPSSPTVQVRFPCAGRWAVELVVVDALGVESAAAQLDVDVVPYTGAARVRVGSDAAFAHHCGGDPLRCTPVDAEGAATAIPLAATVTASDVDPSAVTYRWTVTPPPGLAVGAGRRVAFAPSADVASPTATIETDGAAIAGQWLFTVEARDAAGVIGAATEVVTIGNTPPELHATVPASTDHRYDVSRRFIASAELPITVVDPDGDPVTRRPVVARHLNDGATSEFTVTDAGDVLAWYASVRYETPEDALHLIGAGVVREIELTVDDPNGGTATQTWPIVIGNRPPRAASTVASATAPHRYDPASASYLADAALTTFVDDDGDPLVQAASTGDAACDAIAVDDAGRATVHCALPFSGSPAAGQFAVTHLVQQRVRDPWAEAPAVAPASLVITNRAPAIAYAAFPVEGTCTKTNVCCETDPNGGACLVPLVRYGQVTTDVSPTITDPDGDPMELQVSACGSVTPPSQICFGGTCGPFTVTTCAIERCDLANDDPRGLLVKATDGAATDTVQLTVTQRCTT